MVAEVSHEIALRWMPQDLTDDKSALVQVMAWCRQAQAITWANVDPDLCRQMASLGLNEFTKQPGMWYMYTIFW